MEPCGTCPKPCCPKPWALSVLEGLGALRSCAGDLLRPDDVTFAVLVRGYGEVVPPQWTAISGLLGMMDTRYQLKPSTGEGLNLYGFRV